MPRRAWLIVGVVVVVFAAGITVGVTVLGNRSSAAAVTLEPNTSTGTDPFTSSVAISTAAMPANVQAVTAATRKALSTNPKTHTLVATGTAPGLYGGSGNTHVCDSQQLVGFLQQHPDKASAWAGVLGITTSRIANYVATLTPVLLTNDTFVTNHGYRNGHATTLQSVLQAGTAVMVDTTGTPRVKCNCGNPLTPADPTVTTARLRGTGWPGYTPTQVTVVNAGPVTQSFTLVNITTGGTYTQPTGTGGGAGPWVIAEVTGGESSPNPLTTIVTTTDNKTFTSAGSIPGRAVVALAYGNGTWLAATTPSSGGTDGGAHIFESTDLRTWTDVATLQDSIDGMAYGNGRWAAIGVHTISSITGTGAPHFQTVVYTGTQPTNWTQTLLDASPGGYRQSIAYGTGMFVASVPGEFTNSTFEFSIGTFASTDGTHWKANRGNIANNGWTAMAYGPGQWIVASAHDPGGTSALYTSRDAITWAQTHTSGLDNASLGAIAYGSGTWLAAGQAPTTAGPQPTSSTLYASSNGASWSHTADVNATVTAVAFGAGNATGGTTTPTTTTTPPTTTATPGGQVAATPCPWKDEQTGQPNTFNGPAPTSVTLPAGVTVPAGATVYAPSAHALFVAPAGFRCTATTGEDDAQTVTIVDPANPARSVVFDGGGSVETGTSGCSYFPAQRAIATQQYYCPAPPTSVSYAALPTGSAGTQAAVVAVPTGVAAPWVDGKNPANYGKPTASDVPMLALFVAEWTVQGGTPYGTGDELRCALPAVQSTMCDASLQLMLENSTVTQKAPARTALQQFLAAHS